MAVADHAIARDKPAPGVGDLALAAFAAKLPNRFGNTEKPAGDARLAAGELSAAGV